MVWEGDIMGWEGDEMVWEGDGMVWESDGQRAERFKVIYLFKNTVRCQNQF